MAGDDAPATTDKTATEGDAKQDPGDEATPSANPVAKSPEELAARRKAENEDYEFYKSLADTIDQVERNYVKPIDRRKLMEAAIKGVPRRAFIGMDD